MSVSNSSARIAMAAPSSSVGGSAYSSAMSRHKYASPPPRKPKRVKRSMADQFCTLTACSERLEFHKDSSGWGVRPAINSGESRAKAPDKFVPAFVRKEQGKNAKFSDLGQARNHKVVVASGKALTGAVAAAALQRLAASKLEKREQERARIQREQFQAQALRNKQEKCHKMALSQLERAFK